MKKYVWPILIFLASLFIALDLTVIHDGLQNSAFRIDISGKVGKPNIEVVNVDSGLKTERPKWCKNCVVISGKIMQDMPISAKLKIITDDNVSIVLKGKDLRRNKERVPVYVGYKNFVVDGDLVADKTGMVWHNAPYKHNVKKKAGQVLDFSVVPSRAKLLDLLPYINFDLYLFSLCLCALFMFYSIITKVISKHRNIGMVDIIFVIVFAVLLFIPMLHISDADKSNQENRVLAKKPELIVNGDINEKYGPQFDTWFNDRFNGRDWLIHMYSNMSYMLNKVYQNNSALFIKNNGWMFGKGTVSKPKDIKLSLQNLKKFDEFCKSHNIKLYVLLVPAKEAIYSEILNEGLRFDYKTEKAHNEYMAKLQSAIPGDRVIFPYDELKAAKEKDFIFFKQAHHWTDWGAYNGYKVLSERIKKDFKKYNTVSLSDYDKSFSVKIRDDWGRNYSLGHTTNLLRLNHKGNKLLTTEYTYYDSKYADNVSEERSKYTKVFHNKDSRAKYRLFLTGNSQNEDLLQFLSHSVKDMKYLRLNRGQQSKENEGKFMKFYKQELLDYKPDIVVLCVSSAYVQMLMNNFYKD